MILQPTMLNGYLVRTWFGDDAAWDAVVDVLKTVTADGYLAAIEPISDSAFDGAEPGQILSAVVRQPWMSILTIADEVALTAPDRPVLILSLVDPANNKPFRCTAVALPLMECNLSEANVGWSDLERDTDADGVFRGFG